MPHHLPHLPHFLQTTQKQLSKLREKMKKFKQEQKLKHSATLRDIEKLKAPEIKSHPQRMVMEFSMASVAKATLVVIGLMLLARFLYDIQSILIILFVALFLSAALDSIVDTMQRHRIPRAIGVSIIYLIFLIVIGLFISTLIPLVASQTLELARTVRDIVTNLTQTSQLPDFPYFDRLQIFLNEMLKSVDQETLIANLQTGLEKLASQLQNIAGNTLGAIKVLFNGIFNAILVLVLTFFMIVDEKGIQSFLVSLFPSRHTQYIIAKSDAIKENIGLWLRGQLKLMLIIAVVTFIGLMALGVDYALTLALMAGLTELIPVVGPLIAMIPALLIGLNESPMMAFWIFALYVVIQQLEGNILVPLIMNKAVGLSPLIILVAMLIGYQFLGILGVIISVPLATAFSIFIKDYTAKAK